MNYEDSRIMVLDRKRKKQREVSVVTIRHKNKLASAVRLIEDAAIKLEKAIELLNDIQYNSDSKAKDDTL